MPQMSPMWWSSLMLMFTATLLLMYLITYFYPVNQPNQSNASTSKQMKMTWKW
uniref:ATP synthase complex subunit 8 n=1 Tax=Embiophila sp. TaxID=2931291 RepID=A0A8T9ZYH9_9HEMI|nr:ATPase subunit 8 [Embiophila sp.]